MKYYIDRKLTVWERCHYDTEQELRDAINDSIKGDDDSIFNVSELLYDTITPMEIEENDGCHTIEAYIGDEIIWTNEEIEK